MKGTMNVWLRAAAVAAAVLSGVAPATAADYPAHPITLVVPYAAGGGNDVIARIVAEKMGASLGQAVVIENRGGAGGNIAARQVAKAEPNGYTVLVTTSAYAVNPSLTANAGYVPETDFKTAVVAATSPNIIVAASGLKASNLKELLEAAKTEKFTYGMPGPGTTPHLSAEKIFKVIAKVDIPPVPFTGAAPLLNALLGRHITLACLAMPPTIELIKNGQIKALAVISDKRVPSLPDVPTAIEQGYGDGEESTWMALFVPAGTPGAVLEKLNTDINAVLAEKPILQRLDQLGMLPVGGSLTESEAYVRSEIKKWGEVVRKIGLKVE
jgi:tripartite-type tricarboxylate transporter receptor subunit TctC